MMECEMKLTAHDLEKAIRIAYAKPFDLDKKSWEDSNTQLLLRYLSDKIKIRQSGIEATLELVGFELELTDDLWIYFQFPISPTTFEYDNKVLSERFAMQQNITHFEMDECQSSFVFTKYTTTEKFTCHE